MSKILELAAVAVLLLFSKAVLASTCLPEATLASGIVIGTTTSLPSATATVNKFLGIPFASSPPERFSPPTQPPAWTAPINASAWKPACIQQFNYPEAVRNFTIAVFNNFNPPESEDCLYLNVYAPSSVPPLGGYPVMFWIYGGSLEFGDAGQPYYDGSSFAAYEDVIVVTINYRTNVFGFPNSPELPVTGQNLGFLDQRFALEWVQYNIRSFGGNPQKVTIFGESAGALSVDALVTSYSHNPPFRAAIEESGEVFLRGFLNAGLNSTQSWLTLSAALNCSQSTSKLACARAANVTTIKSIIEHGALGFQPVVDNVTLVRNPAAARAAHNVAPVPVLMGTNGQEGRIFVVGQTNLSAYINNTFGALPAVASQVAQAYAVGVGGTKSDYEAIAQIYTELVFQCPQAITANESAVAGYPTWRYLFNASFPNTQAIPNLAAYHSSEIPIVFGTYVQTGVTAQEYALSNYMRGAWARFAKNPFGGPGWNAIGTFAGTDLGVLGTNGTSGVTVIQESDVDYRCGIFAPLYALFGGA